MESRIAKEIIIVALLFIVVLFVLGILLYDFIPGKNENIKSVEYIADDSVQDVLDEIKENTGIDIKQENTDVLLKSYSIESSDLDVYASENSYESGKSDPFAEDADPVDSSFEKRLTNANTVNSQTSNSSKAVEENKEQTSKPTTVNNTVISETKQEVKNEVTTGTFFEKKDSK